MNIRNLKNRFARLFGQEPEVVVFAPGRINLIGEHTDYNGGYVLPAAIDRGLYFAIAQNTFGVHRWYADDVNEHVELPKDHVAKTAKGWADYLLGAYLDVIRDQVSGRAGVDCVFAGDLPVGAGLSSSSALTCGFLFGLNQLIKNKSNHDLVTTDNQRAEIAWAAHHIERDFIGLNGGIMDQHACLLGRAGHFLYLNCTSHDYKHIPASFDAHKIVLINTNVQHTLTDSDYNTRAQECSEALQIAQRMYNVENLSALSYDQLNQLGDTLPKKLRQRVEFVLAENARVGQVVDHILLNEWDAIAGCLYASHEGLQKKYHVSCPELDYLVELSNEESDILGARMMGGGFGGCTLNIVNSDSNGHWRNIVQEKYFNRFNTECDIIEIKIADGAKRI